MRSPWSKKEPKEVIENVVEEMVEEQAVEELPTKGVLEKFQEEVERTRQTVLKRLSEMNTQQECIKVLSIVKEKLDQKNGDRVSVACKGYGIYTVDGEEVTINKDVTMDVMLSMIDMIPAFCRDEPTTTIEPKVDVWFSKTTE